MRIKATTEARSAARGITEGNVWEKAEMNCELYKLNRVRIFVSVISSFLRASAVPLA
jgi:hypothetical protein